MSQTQILPSNSQAGHLTWVWAGRVRTDKIENTGPLTKTAAITSSGLLECRPNAAKLFVCMFVTSQERRKNQSFMWKLLSSQHQQQIQHHIYIACKPIKICINPASVPTHQARTSGQTLAPVASVALCSVSGKSSIKIKISFEDWVISPKFPNL